MVRLWMWIDQVVIEFSVSFVVLAQDAVKAAISDLKAKQEVEDSQITSQQGQSQFTSPEATVSK